MYILQDKPDQFATLRETGGYVMPLVTLKDEHGGVSHIIEDDHCYVLLNGSYDRDFAMVYHWYPEAVEAMKTLTGPKPA